MDSFKKLHEKIHSFENNSKVLKFKLEYMDIPLWPLIRLNIIISCIDKTVGTFSEQKIKNMFIRENKLKEYTIRNPFWSMPKDVIYMGFPNTNMDKHEDGFIYDDRIKPYMDVNKKSSMLISITARDEFKYAYQNWKSDYFINQLAQTLVIRKKYVSKKDCQTAKEFIRFLEREMPYKMDKALLKNIFNTIMNYSNWMPVYTKIWRLYLKVVKPSLVVICCGCYMEMPIVAMNLACNDLNIPTAEIQHAWVGKTSHAYYWGNAVTQNDDCKRIFPDFFLTMGKYWNTQVNIPSKKIIIGTHRKYQVNVKERKDNILICLSTHYESYVDLVETIIKNTGMNTGVYLRLHPLENTEEMRALFSKFKRNSRFQFANEKKLEFYLEQCTYIVSCGSTVIYEALTCGKIVFVPKDQMYEWYGLDSIEDKIYTFQTLEQFEKLWTRRHEIHMKAYDGFYDMNYEELYGRFINKMIRRRRKGQKYI